MAGLCLVIQKASSTLISKMNELTFIFLLWFVPEPVLCLPLTAGVNGTVQMFYCERCAANVTKVFCKDEILLDYSQIPNCSGPQQPNSVCQRNSWVFVSTNTSGVCEFEGENPIETKKCTDLNICFYHDLISSSSTVSPNGPQVAPEDHTKHIVMGVVGLLLLLVLVFGLIAYFRKKRLSRQLNLEQQSETGENKSIEMDEKSGDIIERAPLADSGLDDNTSPSLCVKGV